ncbi:MAG: insulinase family protein [Pseudomonadales bacterium]
MTDVACHPSFTFVRRQNISSLNVEMLEFRHKVTGAPHYHIAADHEENVFLVAFRTVPMDSTGVAHVLEHTALCGSDKYPVRDPFFMMTRRSLNTFMNAFTSSDWTAYPFASQNRKDYFNLLDVYLDAAFHSRLDPLDFAQEGHRVEFKEQGNADSALEYKGVVYNEMKGAMSSPVSTLWQTFSKHLFPTQTYHYNSGGDPESITDLSYQQLSDFYKTHYHPSNAIFMTFGNIDASELQQRFEEGALSNFEALDVNINVADEKRYFSPVRVEEGYDLDEPELESKTHHVMGWLLGHSIDLKQQLEAHLLSRVLLDNSASPLRAALESTDLGKAPSPLCGLEDSNREMSFMCGLEGSDPERAAEFEALVMGVLEQVEREGVAQDVVEAQLHQLELGQREISGDGYPYGLNLIMAAMSSAVHRGDPIALLNLDPVLDEMREEIKAVDFIPKLVRKLLLDNAHYVRLTLRPDNQLAKRRAQEDERKLEAMRQQMSAEQRQQVIDQAAALEARQAQVDDASILPEVTLADVPAEQIIAQGETLSLGQQPMHWYGQGTNGLVYQQVIIELPALSDEECQLLPLLSLCMSELGCAERDYQSNQQRLAQVTGGINVYTSMRASVENEQDVSAFLVVSGKGLTANGDALLELVQETLLLSRFDELGRIRELVAQQRSRREQSITGSGHSLAMMAASAQLAPCAWQSHRSRGLAGIAAIKTLDDSLQQDSALEALGQSLAALHRKLVNAQRRFLLVAEPAQRDSLVERMHALWQDEVTGAAEGFSLASTRRAVKELWLTSTQVNFCAKAYPTVSVEHQDAAALTVLGDFLRNGFLHRAIREQGGAYGSGAGQDSGDAVFRFFSYRDPRLEETLSDFDASVSWLRSETHDPKKLEEAILGVVSSIDKPASPAGEAKQAYHSELFGRTPEQRRAFRARILAVTLQDLLDVAERYLQPEHASVAVVTNADTAQAMDESYTRISL